MLKYVIGDATEPVGEGIKVIPHVCNDGGRWGSGFVLALSKKCLAPERHYLGCYNDNDIVLGKVDIVPFQSGIRNDLYVANMIAQRGINNYTFNYKGKVRQLPPIRYTCLKECMLEVLRWVGRTDSLHKLQKNTQEKFSVHCPRFGSGLAGGSWDIIEAMIMDIWVWFGELDVFVYDLQKIEGTKYE